MNQDLKQYTQLHDENIELKKEIERLKGEREWISVKDRLPEIWKDYLVTDGGACMVAEFMIESQEWNFFGISWWSNGHVTHWMPLPEPPKQ